MSKTSGTAKKTFSRHELKAIRESIECEEDLQKYLKAGLESQGWDVIRERTPDRSNLRVDLVAIHAEYGKIGIETKYRTDGSFASHVSAAIRQIMEYSSKKYFGNEIKLWSIGIYDNRIDYIESVDDDNEVRWYRDKMHREQEVAQRMVNGFGIGWIDLMGDRVVNEYAADTPTYRIPLFTLESGGWPWWYTDNGDFDRETVTKKIEERWLC